MVGIERVEQQKVPEITYNTFKQTVLNDYKLAVESRQVSVLGRKVVLSGKAKFGIFGSGKEVAQIAMAKAFQKGDWRSGYYRDQTFAFATNLVTYKQYFAQLYSDPRKEKDPHSMGRQMNAHFANKLVDENGAFLDQTKMNNTAADLAPTASQMPRSVGLALASKLYRSNKQIKNASKFTKNGSEICFATIGDASCAEGLFWESLNAAAVQKIPLCISVWDDGYGISVPAEYQISKDYSGLVQMYQKAAQKIRETHRPALIHIKEVTQPQGHSTSGSHQRYKSSERLMWEKNHDCNVKFRSWILENNIAEEKELEEIEQNAKKHVKDIINIAYNEFLEPIDKQRQEKT